MEQTLTGKVAIVTGASRNQGRAYSEMLAASGAKVVIHYHRDQAEAQAVADNIEQQGGQAIIVQANLRNVAEIEALFQQTIATFGRLDILINNAGMVIKKPMVDFTEEEYDNLFGINAKAAFFCMREAAKVIADNGRIINIGTTLLGATTAYYAGYAGSKAPLEDFTRALAKEIGSRGITVNTVAPGPLNTSFFFPAETPDSVEFLKHMSVTGELGEIADVVPMIKFLVSPEARWVTAQTIFVNGGFVAR